MAQKGITSSPMPNGGKKSNAVFFLGLAVILALVVFWYLFLTFVAVDNFPFDLNPVKETIGITGAAVSRSAMLLTTVPVSFSAPNTIIANAQISDGVGEKLAQDQICLLKGYFADDKVFRYVSGQEGNAIELVPGISSKEVRISVLCDSSMDDIESDLKFLPSLKADVDKGSGLNACDNVPKCSPAYSGTDTCCIIVLRSAS